MFDLLTEYDNENRYRIRANSDKKSLKIPKGGNQNL